MQFRIYIYIYIAYYRPVSIHGSDCRYRPSSSARSGCRAAMVNQNQLSPFHYDTARVLSNNRQLRKIFPCSRPYRSQGNREQGHAPVQCIQRLRHGHGSCDPGREIVRLPFARYIVGLYTIMFSCGALYATLLSVEIACTNDIWQK